MEEQIDLQGGIPDATLSDAPVGNDPFSPNSDKDTPEPKGEGTEVGGDTEEAARRWAEIEKRTQELEKRLAGQTKSWQEERRLREAHEERLARWKAAGLDPDEIDKAITAAQGAVQGTSSQPQQTRLPDNVVTTDQFHTALLLREWEKEKDDYLEKHSDLDTQEMRLYMDALASAITKKELDEFGRIVSTPRQVRKEVEKKIQGLESKVEKKLRKVLTEERTKVSGQGVVESDHKKVSKPSTDVDEPPMSPQDYAGMFMRHQDNILRKAAPDRR